MLLTPTNFALIRQFILREGDQKTYCNMYNNNPHLGGLGFDVFLNPADGQKNIGCDPELGGFDTIVISDPRAAGFIDVRLDSGKLHFKASDKEYLEYYFAALISHISLAA